MRVNLKERKYETLTYGDVIVSKCGQGFMICKADDCYTLVNLQTGTLDNQYDTFEELMSYALSDGDVVIKNNKLELVEID